MKRTVIAAALSIALSVPAFADEIKIEGGGTAINTVFLPIKRRYEKLHGDYLTIVQSSAVKGLIALNDGKIDIATGAHPLEDIIAGAAKDGVVMDPAKFTSTQVGDNELVVIASRDSEVRQLSKEQLKGIFTGKIRNWKEVGGKDLPVVVVWGKETEGQNVQFTRIALDGEAVTATRRTATTYRDIAETVARQPGSVGVVSHEMSTAATRSIDTIAIASPIYAFTKGAPSAKVQSVLDFYKTEYGFLK
ncbi:substrate-binding domain-containing protein [Geomonas subterranea]|uniref:Substrate-binding domain-containing protein n=1 Tax=Geomonas subterranea TaxID=2847989 RepID=A0ABX8LRQ7_9BACT|nr:MULTISPECIES: substrate-binding domain-containing protein [Geomonas]QXE92948.1 substrate-binding domain-containing protein [Geomonas subterranea]QXM08946.1 substrate-binding domain-containing protein [Geomonas subterranea]